jgi:small-conductance mechanosensitive channel
MHHLLGDTRAWLIGGSVLAGVIVVSLILQKVAFFIVKRVFRKRGAFLQHALTARAENPARFIFPLIGLALALPFLPISHDIRVSVQRVLGLGVIACVGWATIVAANVISDTLYARYSTDAADDLIARRIRTQTQVLHRIVVMIVLVVTAGIMLMTFPEVRRIGVSLLASAGLAGLVVGVAARSTLSSLIAGVQIALTQPMRLDDAVVVEGEWGWIEEITTTYVVIKIWDLRRLVVPLSYFIDKPFQNWTRTTANLLGTVMIYADYRLPVDDVREELHRLLESSDLWDKKAWGLQVTDATDKTMQLRALVSASDGSRLWDLRCYIREKLIAYIASKHPDALPFYRQDIVHDGRNAADNDQPSAPSQSVETAQRARQK